MPPDSKWPLLPLCAAGRGRGQPPGGCGHARIFLLLLELGVCVQSLAAGRHARASPDGATRLDGTWCCPLPPAPAAAAAPPPPPPPPGAVNFGAGVEISGFRDICARFRV